MVPRPVLASGKLRQEDQLGQSSRPILTQEKILRSLRCPTWRTRFGCEVCVVFRLHVVERQPHCKAVGGGFPGEDVACALGTSPGLPVWAGW